MTRPFKIRSPPLVSMVTAMVCPMMSVAARLGSLLVKMRRYSKRVERPSTPFNSTKDSLRPKGVWMAMVRIVSPFG